MSCLRSAPTTFRMPISIALRNDRAVARLIKLKQAITSTNMAIMVSALHKFHFPCRIVINKIGRF
jgi:hypothetical protein